MRTFEMVSDSSIFERLAQIESERMNASFEELIKTFIPDASIGNVLLLADELRARENSVKYWSEKNAKF